MITDDTKYRVLEAVVDWWGKSNFGPTVEDIRQEVGLEVRSAVQYHVNHLRDAGLLTSIPRRARTLRPTEKGSRMVQLFRELAD